MPATCRRTSTWAPRTWATAPSSPPRSTTRAPNAPSAWMAFAAERLRYAALAGAPRRAPTWNSIRSARPCASARLLHFARHLARQAIGRVQLHPVHMRVPEHVRLRRALDRTGEVRQRHVQFPGPARAAEEHRRAAVRAEATLGARRRAVPLQPAVRIEDAAGRRFQPDPGDEGGAAAALALRAMAVRDPLAGQLRGEGDVAAQAASFSARHAGPPHRVGRKASSHQRRLRAIARAGERRWRD